MLPPPHRFTRTDTPSPYTPLFRPALSTTSPYWQGEDSGYASYRTVIWSRWPTSGMPPSISSPEELQAIIDDLLAIGAIEDETHLYWWVRPSLRHPARKSTRLNSSP